MKIQIASDLHLEFRENLEWIKNSPLKPSSDILLLAGDIICDKYKKEAKDFYQYVSDNYELVISAMGNHEFYHGEIAYAYPDYNEKISHNHNQLNNQSIIYKNVKIIVSVLWSFIPDQKKEFLYNVMNDYRLIYKKQFNDTVNLLIEETNQFHQLSVEYIKNELNKKFDGKIIVLTHHLPSFQCIRHKFKNIENIKYAIATDLEQIINDYKIDYWIFGHIHDSVNIKISETGLISNPLGYMKERQKDFFNPNYVINT